MSTRSSGSSRYEDPDERAAVTWVKDTLVVGDLFSFNEEIQADTVSRSGRSFVLDKRYAFKVKPNMACMYLATFKVFPKHEPYEAHVAFMCGGMLVSLPALWLKRYEVDRDDHRSIFSEFRNE